MSVDIRSQAEAPEAAPRAITLTVNGKRYSARAEPRKTLADFLREDLGLTGTRVGCEHGSCGACTVLLNGAAVRSCLMLAVQADGQELMTIEGLADGNQLHPIQQAFWEEHGLQCGYCTAGIIMSLYEMLRRNPKPSDEEIYDTLGGHLCRCTGYQDILKSAKLAIKLIGG
ncbi:MAG: (2Fe-2S)-binding protein [Chloroflexi bacterium]|nr:(2Fe-2S)-binding protein [Chloroflexota bacterium]